MTLDYTTRFHMGVPDFLSEPWHSEFATAMEMIDRALYDSLITSDSGLWQNDHVYIIGNIVVDSSTGSVFTCVVAHTSSSVTVAPTLADERVLHPTYWTTQLLTSASQEEAEAGVENSKYMTALRTAQAVAEQIAPPISDGFSAHKNGATQTGFTHAVIRKVTFPTTAYNAANHYDAANSRWTPPAGLVRMSAGVGALADLGSLNNGHLTMYLYKNNASFKQAFFNQPTTPTSDINMTADDYANGTDYYEIFISSPAVGITYSVSGVASASYFMGHVVCPA